MAGQDAILLVDDDQDLAEILREYLEGKGYAVVVANTGQAGLKRLRETPPALLLLDLRLPDMDGLEIMREALRLDEPPEIVIATGHATLDSAIAAVEAGAAGYVLKPFDFPCLGALVGKVFERRRLTRENAGLGTELADRLREAEVLLAISTTGQLDAGSPGSPPEALPRADAPPGRRHRVGVPPRPRLGPASPARRLPCPQGGPRCAGYRPAPVAGAGVLPTPLEGPAAGPLRRRRPESAVQPCSSAASATSRGSLVPLILDEEVVGAFYVVWWAARRSFTERELRLVENVSGQVSLLLRNAHLYEQAQKTRRQLETLYDVSGRLGGGPRD